MITLHREIKTLGEAGNSEWARGYNEALEEVLAILERREFSDAEDAGAELIQALNAIRTTAGLARMWNPEAAVDNALAKIISIAKARGVA